MRSEEEITQKIAALHRVKTRMYEGDGDMEGAAVATSAIMALKLVLGEEDFDI